MTITNIRILLFSFYFLFFVCGVTSDDKHLMPAYSRSHVFCFSRPQVEGFSRRSSLGAKLEMKAVKLGLLPAAASAACGGEGPISRYIRLTVGKLLAARRARWVGGHPIRVGFVSACYPQFSPCTCIKRCVVCWGLDGHLGDPHFSCSAWKWQGMCGGVWWGGVHAYGYMIRGTCRGHMYTHSARVGAACCRAGPHADL